MSFLTHIASAIAPPDHVFSPEETVLCKCSLKRSNNSFAKDIEGILRKDLNWSAIVSLAKTAGTSCCLAYNLQHMPAHLIPQVYQEQLIRNYRIDTLSQLASAKELLRILQLLAAAGIPAIPYKGPTLAVYLYEDISLRKFSDLDIVIDPNDFIRAKHILHRDQYTSYSVDDRQEALNIWSDHERDFIRRDQKFVLDLHWRLIPRFYFSGLCFEDAWERHQPLTFLNEPIPTLSPEDLLIVLCTHGTKECWSKLKWVCDIAELIQCYPLIDWDILLHRAKTMRCQKSLLLGLSLARAIFSSDVSLPPIVQQAVDADKNVKGLQKRTFKWLFPSELTPSRKNKHNFIEPTYYRLIACETLLDKVEHIIWKVFIPNVRDRNMLKLPNFLSWIYYFMRPYRLLAKRLGFHSDSIA